MPLPFVCVLALTCLVFSRTTVADTTAGDSPNSNVFEVLAGRGIRSSIQAKDLTAAWRVVRLEAVSEANAMARGRGNRGFVWNDLFYTRGDFATVGDHTYFVAYRVVPPIDPQEVRRLQQFWQAWQSLDESERKTEFPPLDENTPLALSLLSMNQGINLHDIRAFDPELDVLTEDGKARQKVQYERVISQTNLKQVSLGLVQYIQDYDEMLPPMRAARSSAEYQGNRRGHSTPTTPVQVMLFPYVRNFEIFEHPGTKRPYLPNYRISRKNINEFHDSARTITFFEDAPDAEGKRNVAFLDGHVEALDEAEWQKLRKEQGISDSGLPSAMPGAVPRVSAPAAKPPPPKFREYPNTIVVTPAP